MFRLGLSFQAREAYSNCNTAMRATGMLQCVRLGLFNCCFIVVDFEIIFKTCRHEREIRISQIKRNSNKV